MSHEQYEGDMITVHPDAENGGYVAVQGNRCERALTAAEAHRKILERPPEIPIDEQY